MTNNFIGYLLNNEKYFVPVLDYCDNNYTKLPKNIAVFPFYDTMDNTIVSAIAVIKKELVYLNITENHILQSAKVINNKIPNIFSLHGETSIIKKLLKLLNKKPRENTEYYTMILRKKDYSSGKIQIKDFIVKKTDETYFNLLKELQQKYHIEEVYNKSNYYPYKFEMMNYRKTLKNRINFTVFKNNNYDDKTELIPVSKVNVNGESLNFIQIGGVYTLKPYRNNRLATLCLTNLFDYLFKETNKSIILFVKKDNEPAINLYKKFGFKITYNLSICYF